MRTSMDVLMKSIHEAQRELVRHPALDASIPQKEATTQDVGRKLEELQLERSLKIEDDSEDDSLKSTAPPPSPIADEHLKPRKAMLYYAGREDGDLLPAVLLNQENIDKDEWNDVLSKASLDSWTSNQQALEELEGASPVATERIANEYVLKGPKAFQTEQSRLLKAEITAETEMRVKLLEEKDKLIEAVREAIAREKPLDQYFGMLPSENQPPAQDCPSSQANTAYYQSLEDVFASLSQLEVIGGQLEGAHRQGAG